MTFAVPARPKAHFVSACVCVALCVCMWGCNMYACVCVCELIAYSNCKWRAVCRWIWLTASLSVWQLRLSSAKINSFIRFTHSFIQSVIQSVNHSLVHSLGHSIIWRFNEFCSWANKGCPKMHATDGQPVCQPVCLCVCACVCLYLFPSVCACVCQFICSSLGWLSLWSE